MNRLKYGLDASALQSRIASKLMQIERDYKNNKIKTEAEFLLKLKDEIIKIKDISNEPLFKQIEFGLLPTHYDYLTMLNSFVDDIGVVKVESDTLYSLLEYTSSSIDNIMQYLKNNIKVISSKIEKLGELQTLGRNIIFKEDFSENKNKAQRNDNFMIAFCDTDAKELKLPIKSEDDLTFYFDAKVGESSNGLPGNTHEAYGANNAYSEDYNSYAGEEELNINLNNIFKKDNSSFNFEIFNLTQRSIESTSKIGFLFKEDISWISDTNKLILELKLFTNKPVKLNSFVINSPIGHGIKRPIIKEVFVSDGSSSFQKIVVNRELDESVTINFPAQIVESLNIRIEQPNYYMVNVFRIFEEDDIYHNSNYFNKLELPTSKKELEKEKRISIENYGLMYDTSASSIIYPNTETTKYISDEFVKSRIFYNEFSYSNNIKKELVEAKKYNIDIQRIVLLKKEYNESGLYISPEIKSDIEITSIILNSTHLIPDSFKNVKENFIKYYISINNGSDWINIEPRASSSFYKKFSIIINSRVSIHLRNPNLIYIDSITSVKSLQVKIELTRPPDFTNESPIIKEYNIELNTIQEV